jgi:hypothetical protein
VGRSDVAVPLIEPQIAARSVPYHDCFSPITGTKSSGITRRTHFTPFLVVMNPILAIGRKNYLFAGSDAGGRRAAAIYSLIESAKLNGLNPQHYLADVLVPEGVGGRSIIVRGLIALSRNSARLNTKTEMKPTAAVIAINNRRSGTVICHP